jgi:hypothetical protein
MQDISALNELNGQVVLVCSARDQRNPPTGRRGTLFVRESERTGEPVVEVEVDFPQMFTSRAHVRRAVLSAAEIEQMLASTAGGTLIVTLADRLDPTGAPGNG